MKQNLSLILFLFLMSVNAMLAQEECTGSADCEYGIGVEEITSYPEPNVQPLYPQDDVLYDRIYRKVEGALNIYDSPGGTVIGTLDEGYNYVTLSSLQDGWHKYLKVNGYKLPRSARML